jgi:hypothetical protein
MNDTRSSKREKSIWLRGAEPRSRFSGNQSERSQSHCDGSVRRTAEVLFVDVLCLNENLSDDEAIEELLRCHERSLAFVEATAPGRPSDQTPHWLRVGCLTRAWPIETPRCSQKSSCRKPLCNFETAISRTCKTLTRQTSWVCRWNSQVAGSIGLFAFGGLAKSRR